MAISFPTKKYLHLEKKKTERCESSSGLLSRGVKFVFALGYRKLTQSRANCNSGTVKTRIFKTISKRLYFIAGRHHTFYQSILIILRFTLNL